VNDRAPDPTKNEPRIRSLGTRLTSSLSTLTALGGPRLERVERLGDGARHNILTTQITGEGVGVVREIRNLDRRARVL
jgi:hypothetical protein